MKKLSKIILFILILLVPVFAFGDKKEERDALEKELEELEEMILRYDKDITKTEAEKESLQYRISNLKRKISQLDLQIRQSNLTIQNLGLEIKDTEESIIKTSKKINNLEEKLTNILRTIHREDKKSYVEIVFTGENLSDFFDNLVYLEVLNLKNKEILKDIKDLKLSLEGQKVSLDERKSDLEKTVKIHALQKQENEEAWRTQEQFLKMTENQYQQYLKEKRELEERAAEIRAKIFQLAGTPTTEAPTFGKALEIAQNVEKRTSVRPALLLAILQQESALGRNVGQCYLVNQSTGEGIEVKSNKRMPRTMKPSRDVSPFLQVTKELGLKWNETLVSCPMSIGWGGAMGPAQFIPSTWMVYKERLQQMLGRAASPWVLGDAFLASGLYLSDYGAMSQKREGEWKAAMIYFSGSTTNSSFFWYADQVLIKANCIQNFIDTNSMSAECQKLISLY